MENKKIELRKRKEEEEGKWYLKEDLGILVLECRYEEEDVGRATAIDAALVKQQR